MHKLDVDIADTLNINTFRVTDNSSMDCDIPVSDGLLEVFAPTFAEPIIQRVEPKFSIIFNSANLRLTPPNTLLPLPDGVYRIHYSVAPNAYVYIDYMYFRTSQLVDTYNLLKYNLYKEKCDLTKSEFDKRLKVLNDIRDLIEGAKYAVEDQHDLVMGNQLYSEAKSLLSKC